MNDSLRAMIYVARTFVVPYLLECQKKAETEGIVPPFRKMHMSMVFLESLAHEKAPTHCTKCEPSGTRLTNVIDLGCAHLDHEWYVEDGERKDLAFVLYENGGETVEWEPLSDLPGAQPCSIDKAADNFAKEKNRNG